ncbi:MAG: hypothetical protein LQ345_007036 [Seirophora villosa]|nr:MAG: hypothetical protein LQ345_007036 [Seirophora villosa]
MAAPSNKTLKDLNGKWVMNKTLSDDTDRILQMQGVGWFLRRAISLATITLTVKEYTEDDLTHIDIHQVATGNIQSTEERTLDWVFREHSDRIFGEVNGKSRWVKLEDVNDDAFLKEGWEDLQGEHVQGWVESKGGGWTADQLLEGIIVILKESALDYYTRTAPRKYNRRICRHTGIVADRHTACAATLPGQKTCMHASTTAGDIVNYIPMGNPNDVPGDAPVPAKLSMHFMVLLPKYYKPIQLQSSPAHHAALVITKNPIGASTLLAPQPHSDAYKATNVPYFQTLPFDAHSARRRVVVDEAVEGRWVWKENTSVGYQVKIVHQENLHAVIYPGHPTLGLRLSDGAFEQVLGNLGEEDEELEYMRLVRNVEFWGEADSSRGRRKPSHCVDDAAGAADARSSCGD